MLKKILYLLSLIFITINILLLVFFRFELLSTFENLFQNIDIGDIMTHSPDYIYNVKWYNPYVISTPWCIFILGVMIKNYRSKKENLNFLNLLKKIGKNLRIFFCLLRTHFVSFLLAVFTSIISLFVLGYGYSMLFNFKISDPLLAHIFRLFCLYPLGSIVCNYSMNYFLFNKVEKLSSNLKNISIGYFLYIVFIYILFVYSGLYYILLNYALVLSNDILLILFKGMCGFLQLHSTGNAILKKILYLVTCKLRVSPIVKFKFTPLIFEVNKPNGGYNLLNRIKAQNFYSSLLFSKPRAISESIRMPLQENSFLDKKLFISEAISIDSQINKSGFFLGKRHNTITGKDLYVKINLKLNKTIFISTNPEFIEKINNLNYNTPAKNSSMLDLKSTAPDKIKKLEWYEIWGEYSENKLKKVVTCNKPYDNDINEFLAVNKRKKFDYDYWNEDFLNLNRRKYVNMPVFMFTTHYNQNFNLNISNQLDLLNIPRESVLDATNNMQPSTILLYYNSHLVLLHEEMYRMASSVNSIKGYILRYNPPINISNEKIDLLYFNNIILQTSYMNKLCDFDTSLKNLIKTVLVMSNQLGIEQELLGVVNWIYTNIARNFPIYNSTDIYNTSLVEGENLDRIYNASYMRLAHRMFSTTRSIAQQANSYNITNLGGSIDNQLEMLLPASSADLSLVDTSAASNIIPSINIEETSSEARLVENNYLANSYIYLENYNPVTDTSLIEWDERAEQVLRVVEKRYTLALAQVLKIPAGRNIKEFIENTSVRNFIYDLLKNSDNQVILELLPTGGNLGKLLFFPQVVNYLREKYYQRMALEEEIPENLSAGFENPDYIKKRWLMISYYHLLESPNHVIGSLITNSIAKRHLNGVIKRSLNASKNITSQRIRLLQY